MDVRMPDGVVVRGVPDDITQEELLQRYRQYAEENRTVGGYAKEALKAIPRGLVGGLESAALGAAALLPGDTQEGFEKTAREGIKGFAERLKPKAAFGYEEAIPTKLGEAVGSMGSLLIPGGAGGLAARGLGLAAGAGRTAAAGATAAGMGAGEARERAVTAGATPEQITSATQLGVIPGIAELAPIEWIFRVMPKEIKGGIFDYVQRALVTGGMEGAQEAASAVAQNLITQQVYKPSQELVEGVGENAAYGAGAGAIVQFLLDAVAGRRAAAAKPTTPTAAESVPEQPEQSQEQAQPVATQPIPTGAQQPLFEPLPAEGVPPVTGMAPSGKRYSADRFADEEAQGADVDLASALMERDELLRVKGIMEREFQRAPTREEAVSRRLDIEAIDAQLKAVNKRISSIEKQPTKREQQKLSKMQGQLDLQEPSEPAPVEPAVTKPEATKITRDTLLGLGFNPTAVRTSKVAKALQALDMSKPEDIAQFEALVKDYGDRSSAKQPFNDDAVKQFVAQAREKIDAIRPEAAGEGMGVPVLGQTAGRTGAAGDGVPVVAGGKGPAGPVNAGEEQKPSPLSDVEEVETAAARLRNPKDRTEYRQALIYLVDTATQKQPKGKKAQAEVAPQINAAKQALQDPSITKDELALATEAVNQLRTEREIASAKQARAAGAENAELKRAAQAVEEARVAEQEAEAKQADWREAAKAGAGIDQALAAKRDTPEWESRLGLIRNAAEKVFGTKSPVKQAEKAADSRKPFLKAPTDGSYTTEQDALLWLDTLISDAEAGDPAKRAIAKREKRAGRSSEYAAEPFPVREAVSEKDRAEIVSLMRDKQYDAAYTTSAVIVFRAIKKARRAAFRAEYDRMMSNPPPQYGLSHTPIGSGLSKEVRSLLDKGDLKGALKLLGETGSTPVIRTAARKILSAIKGTKVLVRKTPTGDAGIYSSTTDTIYIDPEGLHEHTLLHEAMHAAVAHVLANPNHVLTKKLQALFDSLAPEIKGQYGATNLQEFAAEAISNQEFQDVLRGQPKGWWGRFIDAIRGFLGLSKAKQVEKTLDQLLEAAPSETRVEGVKDLPVRSPIIGASFRHKESGEVVVTGPIHDRYKLPGGWKSDLSKWEAGFSTKDGVFLTRKEAADYVNIKPAFGELHSHDFSEMGGVQLMPLPFSAQQPTAAMDAQATRRIAEKQREGDQGFFTHAWRFAFDEKYRVNKIKEYRNAVIFNGAAVEEKLLEKNDLKSVVNLLMATRSMDLATSSILEGSIALDPETGLFRVASGVSLADVHQEVNKIAEKAGVDMDTAKAWFDLGATVLRMRSPEISPEIRKSMALSAEDTQAADDVLRLYGDEIRAGVQKFQQYKNQLLQVGKATGRFTQEDVDEWVKAPEYVPWHRILDDAKFGYETKKSTKKYFKGLVDNGKIAELIGGDVNKRPIGDILGNMENLSFWLVNTIVRNHAANVAMDGLLKIDAKALTHANQGTAERLVKTYRNGEPTFFEVADPLDRHAFLGVESVSTPLFTALGRAANWLRTGTTLMPGFVISQLFQDGFRATALSGAQSPFMVGAKVLGSFKDALAHKGTSLELAAYGIIGRPDFMVGSDRSRIEAALDEGGSGAKKAARHVRGALDAMTRASDASQRMAIYEQTLKETGDKMLALYKASEVINFQRQGRSGSINVLRQIIPFMNAYLQGMDVTYRSMFREGISGKDRTTAMRQFWATGMKIAALGSIYAMLVSDDEDYKKLPDHEKLTGFMIPGSRDAIKELTGTDIGGNLKIPTPQDPIGLMFKTIPEQSWNYIMRLGTKDEVDATKLARVFRDGLVNAISAPGYMPQLLKPGVEVAANYSFFSGNPIIGKGLEGRSKDLQFTSGTSELSKLLSAVTPLAPVQVEHLIRGYLGVLGGTAMYAGGRAIETVSGIERADRRWADVPQATTFITGSAPSGLKDDYYELRQRSREVAEDVKFLMERDPVEAQQRLMENKELYALAKSGFFTQVEQQLSQLRQARRLIEANNNLDSAEKREKLDQIDQYEMRLFSALNLPTLRKNTGL